MSRLGKPGEEFASRALPVTALTTPIVRIHRRTHAHDFFGRTGRNRFDAPDGSCGVLYAGKTLMAAFSETFLRDPPRDIVFQADLDARWHTTIDHDPLMLMSAFGAGLRKIGVTAEIGTCPYDVSQAWSKAVHDHQIGLDGIIWAGRHDNTTRSIALFERARNKLKSHRQESFDPLTVQQLVRRWGFAIG